jgi:hypothetical protein
MTLPGQQVIGPLTVYFPDVSTPEFWFMRDLTEILGVETNAEAEERLCAALGSSTRTIDIDSEADNVLVHASSGPAMVRVLSALDSVAVNRPLWTADELRRTHDAMRVWRRPKPVAYRVDAIASVPLRGGRFGAVHVAAFQEAGSVRGCPLVLLLDLCARSREDLARAIAEGEGKPVGCYVIVETEISSGEWPVLGTRPIRDVDVAALLARERGASSGAPCATDFVEAYAGLRAWDSYDPREYELKLLPGVPPPPSRRYRRDIFEARLVAAFGRQPEAIHEGPAVLDVHIAYPGDGLPRLIDLPKSRQLAERMRAQVPGTSAVTIGGGRGFLDVFARTTDAAAGIRVVEQAAHDLRIHRETLVEAFPAINLEGLEYSAET